MPRITLVEFLALVFIYLIFVLPSVHAESNRGENYPVGSEKSYLLVYENETSFSSCLKKTVEYGRLNGLVPRQFRKHNFVLLDFQGEIAGNMTWKKTTDGNICRISIR